MNMRSKQLLFLLAFNATQNMRGNVLESMIGCFAEYPTIATITVGAGSAGLFFSRPLAGWLQRKYEPEIEQLQLVRLQRVAQNSTINEQEKERFANTVAIGFMAERVVVISSVLSIGLALAGLSVKLATK